LFFTEEAKRTPMARQYTAWKLGEDDRPETCGKKLSSPGLSITNAVPMSVAI
jgi:hypothetical protein